MQIDKEKVEKEIENLTGLIIDFGEAVETLRGIREVLYSLIEKESE